MSPFRRPSVEPLWRDEFSVFSDDERYVSRRQFAKFLVLASLGMFVGNLWILVRAAAEEYAAYSQKCTHLSCAVYYSAGHGRLECPCHNGAFSVRDGSVLQGPPPRPLPRVVLERRGNDLVATGLKIPAEAQHD